MLLAHLVRHNELEPAICAGDIVYMSGEMEPVNGDLAGVLMKDGSFRLRHVSFDGKSPNTYYLDRGGEDVGAVKVAADDVLKIFPAVERRGQVWSFQWENRNEAARTVPIKNQEFWAILAKSILVLLEASTPYGMTETALFMSFCSGSEYKGVGKPEFKQLLDRMFRAGALSVKADCKKTIYLLREEQTEKGAAA